MQWELLTSTDFKKAVKETGICILPLGVMERHGDHLPLGTDFLNAHSISVRAAEIEPAVVFPAFYFGQIFEARCFPGTIAIKPELLTGVLESLVDEIGRNGFEKIIFYNFHGGSWYWLKYFLQCQLKEQKPYNIFIYNDNFPEGINNILSTPPGHACEWETSIMLVNYADFVKMEAIPDEPSNSLNRLSSLTATNTCIDWYSCYPEHYAGDARSASKEKGKAIVDIMAQSLAESIKRVKSDTLVKKLTNEFFERVDKVGRD